MGRGLLVKLGNPIVSRQRLVNGYVVRRGSLSHIDILDGDQRFQNSRLKSLGDFSSKHSHCGAMQGRVLGARPTISSGKFEMAGWKFAGCMALSTEKQCTLGALLAFIRSSA